MLDLLAAAVSWVVIAVVPGTIALLAFKPSLRLEPVFVLGAAPAISLGSWFVLAELLSAVGLGLWPWMPILGVTALSVILWFTIRHTRAEATTKGRSHGSTGSLGRQHRAAIVLLGVSVLIGLAVWAVGTAGSPASPPSRDSEYHAIFVKRIAETGTVAAGDVLVSDPVTELQIAEFYPLGMHNAIAVGHRLAGLDIAASLTVWMVLFAAITLPAGQFSIMRRLLPGKPLAAGLAAFVSPFFVLVTYHPGGWGAVPLVAGFAMIPAVLVLIGRTGDEAVHRWGWRSLSAIAVFGIAVTHPSQLALLAVLAVCLGVADMVSERQQAGAALRRVADLAFVGGASLLLYLPVLPGLLAATGERAEVLEEPFSTTSASLGTMLSFNYPNVDQPQPVVGAIVLAGLWLAARNRVLGRWAGCLLAVSALYLATRTAELPWSIVHPATTPWYSSTWRTAYNVAFVAQLFSAYALYVLVTWTVERHSRAESGLVRQIVGVGAVGLAVLAGVWLLREPVDRVRSAWEDSRPSAEMLAAFEYLGSRVEPGEPILNDDLDGSPWMYPLAGLHPLMAVEPSGATERDTDERAYLAAHIHEYDSNPAVRQLADRFGTRFVLVSDESWLDREQRNNRAQLLASDALEEVYSAGSAHVFEIVR